MAFNTRIPTFLLILSIAISGVAAQYDSTFIAQPPTEAIVSSPTNAPTPAPAPISNHNPPGAPVDGPANTYLPITLPAPAPAPKPDDKKPMGAMLMDTKSMDTSFLKINLAKAAIEIEAFKSTVLVNKLKDPATDEKTKKCLDVCKEVYTNAVDSLKKGLEDINKRDFLSANVDVSAFTTNIDTCTECLGKDNAEFSKFEAWAKGVGRECLHKMAKYGPAYNNLI